MNQEIPKEKVGPYTLIGCIGHGANSKVYEAQEFWGKRVALKLLNGEIEPRRMKREIDAYSHLSHPSLPELLDHGFDPECGHYLVTRLVQGQTLREFADSVKLTPDAVLALAIPLLEGLDAMHRLGFVHRDLKPENLMVDHSGQLVIVDLGLTMRDNHSRLTEEGQVAGSVPYMSPEQIEGRTISRASDVWSLGVILYELLCDRRPFERPMVGEEVAAILRGEFSPLDQVDRRVPAGLAALVHACLQLDKSKRPSSAADLLKRLKKLAGENSGEELARLLTDPQGYLAANAKLHGSRLKKKARKAIEAKDSFTAFELIDRALAYNPDDAELSGLVEEASLRCPRRKARRHRFPWSWGADFVGVAILAVVLAAAPDRPAPKAAPPPAVPAPVEAAVEQRSRAAERKFYSGTGKLAKLLVAGAKAKVYGEKALPARDKSDADRVALDLMGNFADLITDLGSNGTVTVDGQEASADLLGNLVELYAIGLSRDSK